jgi:trehalose-6-phosphate synthase
MLTPFGRRDPEVAEWVSLLRQRYSGMKLLVGRDKLDEIQVWLIVFFQLLSFLRMRIGR